MLNVEQHLIKYGFKHMDNLIGRTPFSGELQSLTGVEPQQSGYRGLQIQESMKIIERLYGKTESYVVLEDEIDDVCGSKCNVIPRAYVVKVDMDEGLRHSNAVDAKDILLGIELEMRDAAIETLIDTGMYKWQARKQFYKSIRGAL